MQKALSVFGTRPEVIKLAPVIKQLEAHSRFQSVACATGQHKEMMKQMLQVFEIEPGYDLEVMEEDQSLTGLTGRILSGVDDVIECESPDIVLVQGDTTTAFTTALAAFYNKVPVGHVEAGLRTGKKYDPFPEELNRVLADSLSELYFAPTEENKDNLLKEGVPEAAIYVTGNPVIDALFYILDREKDSGVDENFPLDFPSNLSEGRFLILVTAHRRESFGRNLSEICRALRKIAARYPSATILYPVHLNPNVARIVKEILGEVKNVKLTAPLSYTSFVKAMQLARVILTDSGGIQEEAPSLGKPVLVMRNTTERPEAVKAGTVKLVGTDSERIVAETARLLDDPDAYSQMAGITNPYGQGDSAERIVEILDHYFHSE